MRVFLPLPLVGEGRGEGCAPTGVLLAGEELGEMAKAMPVLLFPESSYSSSTMKPSDSFRMHRAVIRRLVEAHHARNARVFGSVVRGDVNSINSWEKPPQKSLKNYFLTIPPSFDENDDIVRFGLPA